MAFRNDALAGLHIIIYGSDLSCSGTESHPTWRYAAARFGGRHLSIFVQHSCRLYDWNSATRRLWM